MRGPREGEQCPNVNAADESAVLNPAGNWERCPTGCHDVLQSSREQQTPAWLIAWVHVGGQMILWRDRIPRFQGDPRSRWESVLVRQHKELFLACMSIERQWLTGRVETLENSQRETQISHKHFQWKDFSKRAKKRWNSLGPPVLPGRENHLAPWRVFGRNRIDAGDHRSLAGSPGSAAAWRPEQSLTVESSQFDYFMREHDQLLASADS